MSYHTSDTVTQMSTFCHGIGLFKHLPTVYEIKIQLLGFGKIIYIYNINIHKYILCITIKAKVIIQVNYFTLKSKILYLGVSD